MRKIKFRGKSIQQASRFKNGFAKGSLLIDLDKNGEKVYSIVLLDPYTTPPTCSQMPPNPVQYVKPETVGQFTGLTDNSEEKEEIYGGDIVETESGERWRVAWVENMAGFFLRNIDTRPERFVTISCRMDKTTRLKVVGNVIDNPELLEAKIE